MLNREIPFVRIIVPLCAGIVAGVYLPPGVIIAIASAVLTYLALTLLYFLDKRETGLFFGLIASFFLFVTGLMLYCFEKNSLTNLDNTRQIYYGIVTEYPEEKPKTYKLIIKLRKGESGKRTFLVRGSVIVYLEKQGLRQMLPGDIIRIALSPEPVRNRGNPREFDYVSYLENHGIKYIAMAKKNDLMGLDSPESRGLRYRALIIREKIIKMYRERGISDERLGLIAAMTLGQKNMLEPEQKEIFIKAGVMHIMAVSGLHAMIISLFISNILFFIKGRYKPVRAVITITVLWLFAFVTGLTPSVMRAALMFSFLETGRLFQRNVNGLNSVLASAFVLVIMRPSVIFDAGFLLSYSAVIFIISFYRTFYLVLCCKTNIMDKLWQSAAVTILAQAGTLPLTISLFNRFPVWFIFSNIIIVPMSSALIITGCLIPLTYPLKPVSSALAVSLDYMTGLVETITGYFSRLPLSSIEQIGMTGTEAILLFTSVITLFFWLSDRKKLRIAIPLIAFLIFLTVVTGRDIIQKRSSELIVYNTMNSPCIGIRTGKTLFVYMYNDQIPGEVLRHSATDHLKIIPEKMTSDITEINAGSTKIMVCRRINEKFSESTNPDFLILTGEIPDKRARWVPMASEKVILASGIQDYNSFADNLSENHRIHSVRKNGAVRVKL